MVKYQGLIFDFNGVLLLDQHLHDIVFTKIIREVLGRVPTQEEFKTYFTGQSNKHVFEYLYGRQIKDDELEKLIISKESQYQELSLAEGEKYQLAPGAIALFEKLKARGVPHTIATSSPRMNVTFFDETLHLSKWFDITKIACTEGDVRGKPFPDLFHKAAENLRLPPGECVVIEDSYAGIESAHAAGIGHIIAIGPKEEHAMLRGIPGVTV